jgi:hypothetical protein
MGIATRTSAVFCLFAAAAAVSATTPPPLADIARMPAIDALSISPDGHYLSSVVELNGHVLTVIAGTTRSRQTRR